MFLAIVEAGSFTAAARKLNRATSVISYAIANLEAQLGVSLFERAGARRPRLTEAGRAILSDSRGIALALGGLVAKARGLTQGLEAEVALVVDVMLPAKRLVRALDEFRKKFPTVALRLRVEALGAVTRSGAGRAGGVRHVGTAADGKRCPDPRARRFDQADPGGGAGSSLWPSKAGITAAQLRDHIQLVLTDRSALTAGPRFRRAVGPELAAGRSGAKHALLLAGLGWGNMPKWVVSDDIKRGRLVRLAIEGDGELVYRFHSLYRSDAPPGPAAYWLMERLSQS